MTQHSIPDEILLDYANGSLPEAFDLLLAAHVSIDNEARGRLDEVEAVGGALMDGLDAVDMDEGSLEATLAKITGTAPAEVSNPAAQAPCQVLPRPIRDYVGGGLDSVKWRSVGMGCKQAILNHDGESSARLLYIPAGVEMPDHGHKGTEMTLVLKGAFLDGDTRFARGDVEIADEETEHRPVADTGDDCICLVACSGSLRFTGLLPRIAQPFFRI